MPLYEYQCKKCKHRFEKIQKFSDPPVRKCPECGGAVEKLISQSAVQFKGSGWYVTDYAKKEKESGGHETDAAAKNAKSPSSSEKSSDTGKSSGSGESATPSSPGSTTTD